MLSESDRDILSGNFVGLLIRMGLPLPIDAVLFYQTWRMRKLDPSYLSLRQRFNDRFFRMVLYDETPVWVMALICAFCLFLLGGLIWGMVTGG